MSSGRAESFSDGVFAVAITLLVFNLLPVGQERLTYHSLATAWPQYAAYVVSFLTIGIMWMNHHTLFGHLTRVDRPMLVLNLLLLMGVVAIPFPTALVADHLTSPGTSGGSVAAVLYGVVMIVISVFFNAIWAYLVRNAEALGSPATRRQLREAVPGFTMPAGPDLKVPRWSIGLVGYLAGALIAAFVSPGGALAVYGLLAVFYLFNHLPDPAALASASDPGSGEGVQDLGETETTKLAVIIEVQLRYDPRKEYVWPAYVAQARAAHRCDVILLVICPDSATSARCRVPIRMGHPGFDLTRCHRQYPRRELRRLPGGPGRSAGRSADKCICTSPGQYRSERKPGTPPQPPAPASRGLRSALAPVLRPRWGDFLSSHVILRVAAVWLVSVHAPRSCRRLL